MVDSDEMHMLPIEVIHAAMHTTVQFCIHIDPAGLTNLGTVDLIRVAYLPEDTLVMILECPIITVNNVQAKQARQPSACIVYGLLDLQGSATCLVR